ncbi:hypothetical protein TNCV_4845101 [Trichonephila clavipes]|uniref:Uncharacterized protein n=1 Tax=Trichonephila clavipes TaxID=2585209 RepID=A0A8X7BM34_TRICX|nr:hypothetical protein TNCV_4845101 [Trichonephila clavipes]
MAGLETNDCRTSSNKSRVLSMSTEATTIRTLRSFTAVPGLSYTSDFSCAQKMKSKRLGSRDSLGQAADQKNGWNTRLANSDAVNVRSSEREQFFGEIFSKSEKREKAL